MSPPARDKLRFYIVISDSLGKWEAFKRNESHCRLLSAASQYSTCVNSSTLSANNDYNLAQGEPEQYTLSNGSGIFIARELALLVEQ